jgi:hypothetical protein
VRTVLFASIALLLGAVACDFVQEYWLVRTASNALAEGRGEASVELYEHVQRSGGPRFLTAASVSAGRERALVAAARECIARKDYRQAAGYLMRVPEGGSLAHVALGMSRNLMGAHLAHAEALLDGGRFREAGAELAAIRETYRPAEVQEQSARMKWRLALAQAERALARGDLKATMQATRDLPEDAALPARNEADRLIKAAVRSGADLRYEAADYPGLYRLLSFALTELREQRAALVPFVHDTLEHYDLALFGRSLRRAVQVAPLVAVDAGTNGHTQGTLTIRNTTAHTLTVRFRGPEDASVSVGPRATQSVALRAGEYVQYASAGSVALLGIVAVGSGTYQQVFPAEPDKRGGSPARRTTREQSSHAL